MAERAPGDPRCKDCSADHDPNRSRCAGCANLHRAAAKARADDMRARGRCVVCRGRVAKGRRYCAAHLAYYRERRAS